MARPKRHPDIMLISAAATVIAERGGTAWSLDDVANRTGMSPAALIKRFGSKRELLLAVVRSWVQSIPPYAGESEGDPLAMLEDMVRGLFVELDETDEAVGHLGLLLAEIADPEIRLAVREGWRRQERFFTDLIADAQRQGMIRGPAPDQAGLMVMGLVQGCALRWSVDPRGSLAELQVDVLRTLLKSWE